MQHFILCLAAGALFAAPSLTGLNPRPPRAEGAAAVDTCPLHVGDTVRYAETIHSSMNTTEPHAVGGQSVRRAGLISVTRSDSGVTLSFARENTLGASPANPDSRAAGTTMRFALAACGGGPARLLDSAETESAEFPYRFDGLLIVPPARSLRPASTWTDTLRRIDALQSGTRSSLALRRFRVVADTTIDGVAASLVTMESQGTVLRVESGATGRGATADSARVLVSISTHGAAIFSRASRLMLARVDSAEYRISARAGSITMPEQIVQEERRLALLRR